jgi:hypothetical protein
MPLSDRPLPALLLVAVAILAAPRALAEPAPLRFSAPIEIREAAPFVQMALPPAVYARTEQPDLGDLRVVDARGERVPFALLAPGAVLRTSEQLREAVLYPLPARPAADGGWASPVDVVIEGDRISVSRRGGPAATPPTAGARRESGGWLIDMGEAKAGDAQVRSLRLAWSGPAEFSAAYQLETSDDLRSWRRGGAGQLMALQSPTGALTQPVVTLPDAPGRFVRLVWAVPGDAPAVTGASVLIPERHLVALDAASELSVAPTAPGPPQKVDTTGRAASDGDTQRALQFDLGAALPIVDVDLRFTAGTHVAPVRMQGRVHAADAWRDLGAGVFYRLERGQEIGESPAIALAATLRFVRLIPDERAAALEPAGVRLVVHAQLATLVFATQGQAPFSLLAGSRDAPSGALPVATLVPRLDDERPRFGKAVLGEFGIIDAAARQAEQADREARLRPWLLWSVLLVGVLVLAALVWRLAKTGGAKA